MSRTLGIIQSQKTLILKQLRRYSFAKCNHKILFLILILQEPVQENHKQLEASFV
ncbi:hypothetical protein D3C84_1269370 [compost metagenome]